MLEKLSDKPKREEKVKRAKAKILSEIEEKLNILKGEMNTSFESAVVQCYALYALKEYINKPSTFLTYKSCSPNEDLIDYYVPEKDIDMWLQESYSFVDHHLRRALESIANNGYRACMAVSDNSIIDIGYVDIIGSVLY